MAESTVFNKLLDQIFADPIRTQMFEMELARIHVADSPADYVEDEWYV